jgi:hypothetical protein
MCIVQNTFRKTANIQKMILKKNNPVVGHVDIEASTLYIYIYTRVYIDNQLTDGGDVVSLTRRLPFTPRKIPGTLFS